uniref:Mitochondrial pyruvate carrier n=1 Tax=Setaria digitata TaxID=48799 RepID=A0A915PYF2_9BILA
MKVVYPILPNFLKSSWDHPAGPKTVFFWGPTIKWCLVLAGLADLMRPAEKLSFFQLARLGYYEVGSFIVFSKCQLRPDILATIADGGSSQSVCFRCRVALPSRSCILKLGDYDSDS